MKVIAFTLSLMIPFCLMKTNANQTSLRSRAEATNYTETSRYDDVTEFIAALQRQSDLVKVEKFGTSYEGRALPLVILSKPVIAEPVQAARSGKPVVFIMANIHAGEVEGKEATLHLMREIATGSLGYLLDKLVLLIAPIYNADGNERISINNRTAQNGPSGGVGTRENAKQMDLNRDFMKLESPEARGLIRGVFNRWDPHVIIDLHTTNGSYHGYALTFSPSLNPNTDRRLISLVRERLLPEVSKTLKAKHRYNTYFYGNFADSGNPQRELSADRSTDPKAWATFDHRPRFGNNYEGLRNRIAILSEAYSYLDFRSRVDVTDKFVRAVLDYVASHGSEVLQLIADVDRYATDTGITKGNEAGFGISLKLAPSPKPVSILVGSVKKVIDPRTNRPRFEANNESRPVKMTEYGEFEAIRRIKPPSAYILKPEQQKIVELLLAHGIAVEQTMKDETIEVESYTIDKVTRAERSFQGHRETKVSVTPGKGQERFPEGSFVVSLRQPSAALIFYLLEPESDDGLVNWNFLDELLNRTDGEKIFPVYRIPDAPRFPRQVVK